MPEAINPCEAEMEVLLGRGVRHKLRSLCYPLFLEHEQLLTCPVILEKLLSLN